MADAREQSDEQACLDRERRDNEARREWAERWLSPTRFSTYLDICDGDAEKALELHEWNLILGRELLGDIAHFELALRNAYDRVLTERFEGPEHWLFDANSPVTRPIMRKSKMKKLRDVNLVNRRAVEDARGRAHDPHNPDQVVAGLMLGFWAHMTDRSRERDLWIPYLHAAWPAGTDRAALNLKLDSINKLRNRVVHNERLFNPSESGYSPRLIDTDIAELFRALCPEAHGSLCSADGKTTVERFLEEHPAPAAVEL